MNKFISIVDRRINSSLQIILEDLDSKYTQMLRVNAAKGMLRSGNTVKQTMGFVSECSKSLTNLIAEQSTWVVEQSIYVPKSISAELMAMCEAYFDTLSEEAERYIHRASDKSGIPSIFDRVYPDVEKCIENALAEAKLEIEALVASNHSRGIKGVARYFLSIFSAIGRLAFI